MKRNDPRYQQKRNAPVLAELDVYKRDQHCSACGISFKSHPEMLDFHHPNGIEKRTKGGTPKSVAYYAHSGNRDKMWAEVEKCVPLCANCHRIRHYSSKV